MKFAAGCTPGPGRPKGSWSGRRLALSILDTIFDGEENQALLTKSLQAEFEKNPARFFQRYVVPLLPHESKIAMSNDGVITWKSLLTVQPPQPSDAATLRDMPKN